MQPPSEGMEPESDERCSAVAVRGGLECRVCRHVDRAVRFRPWGHSLVCYGCLEREKFTCPFPGSSVLMKWMMAQQAALARMEGGELLEGGVADDELE